MTTRHSLFGICLIAVLSGPVWGQDLEGSPLDLAPRWNTTLREPRSLSAVGKSTDDSRYLPALPMDLTGLWFGREEPFFHSSGDTAAFRNSEIVIRGQDGESSSGGGDLSSQATNPTSDLTVYQVQNSFEPSTYEASGFAHILGLQAVKPFKTEHCFFPTWITRTTLPVITTADPAGSVPIGAPNDTQSSIPLDNQSGLGDLVFISLLNHPTDWGSWGIGPGFVAPTATRPELGEQSWKFSPTFAVIDTSIPTWQLGILGIYNFPLDGRGTQSLQFQPLIVKQLGEGWYTGWGDDLWSFNMESGNFGMPLQLRFGKVHKICEHSYNIAVSGYYTPDDLRKGPAPEWGLKLSISLLVPGS